MWVIRGGTIGEYETRFHTENKVYLTWDGLNVDLNKADDKDGLNAILSKQYPDTSGNKIKNWTDQIWSFIHDIKPKDWLVLPSRLSPVIHVGQIVSKYTYNKANEDPYYHSRNIKWIERDIPRSNFEQDVLYSLGGFNTIFNISQIQPRFKAMQENDWVPSKHDESSYETTNELIAILQEISRDQIAPLIQTKFRGHRLTILVPVAAWALTTPKSVSRSNPAIPRWRHWTSLSGPCTGLMLNSVSWYLGADSRARWNRNGPRKSSRFGSGTRTT